MTGWEKPLQLGSAERRGIRRRRGTGAFLLCHDVGTKSDCSGRAWRNGDTQNAMNPTEREPLIRPNPYGARQQQTFAPQTRSRSHSMLEINAQFVQQYKSRQCLSSALSLAFIALSGLITGRNTRM